MQHRSLAQQWLEPAQPVQRAKAASAAYLHQLGDRMAMPMMPRNLYQLRRQPVCLSEQKMYRETAGRLDWST